MGSLCSWFWVGVWLWVILWFLVFGGGCGCLLVCGDCDIVGCGVVIFQLWVWQRSLGFG